MVPKFASLPQPDMIEDDLEADTAPAGEIMAYPLHPRGNTLPMQVVDKVEFDATLERGFKRFPERYDNYVRARDAPLTAVCDTFPTLIYLEPVGRCNFRCIMCELRELPRNRRGEDYGLEEFCRVFEQFPSVVEVKLNGVGESLLHRNIFDMIDFVAERDVWIQMSTNASLLNHRNAYRRLIDSGIGELSISIDGGTKKTFEAIRIGGVFEKVTDNCKRINDYADTVGKYKTRSYTAVQSGNRHELETIVRLAAKLGFKRQTFAIGLQDWGNQDLAADIEKFRIEEGIPLDQGWDLVDLGLSLGVDVTFLPIQDKYTLDNICNYPFRRAYVGVNRKIGACCRINPEFFQLGDVDEFEDAWNSPAFQEFRQAHLDGNIPPVCQNCYKC